MAPLTSTNELIEEYGEELINGTISDERLIALSKDARFARSETYPDPEKPITDDNHSLLQALQDFVATIGPQISLETFHIITTRLIATSKQAIADGDPKGLMRNSTLDKCFLAFEYAHAAKTADTHFEEGGVLSDWFTGTDKQTFIDVLIRPGIEVFTMRKGQAKLEEKKARTALIQVITDTQAAYLKNNIINNALNTNIQMIIQMLEEKPSNAIIKQFQKLIQEVKEAEKKAGEYVQEAPKQKTSSGGCLSWLMEKLANFFCRLLSPFVTITGKKETIPQARLSDIMEKYVPKLENRDNEASNDSAHI